MRVCTVNLTFSFSLSASEISTCNAFSPSAAGVTGADEELSGDVAVPLPLVVVAVVWGAKGLGEDISMVPPLFVVGLFKMFDSSVPS